MKAIFRIAKVWGNGFSLLLMIFLLAALALVVSSVLSWVVVLALGLKGGASWEWISVFVVLITPYIFGRARTDLPAFIREKS